MTHVHHIPMRTCVLCREIAAQHDLVRLVASGDRVVADHRRRCSGRGAYVHPGLRCRANGKGEDARLAAALARAFRRGVRPAEVVILRADLLGASASDRDSVERNPQNKAKDDTGSRSEDARL